MTPDSVPHLLAEQASVQGVKDTFSPRTMAPNGAREVARLRRIKAIEMRAAGHSYREIAAALGYRSVASVYETVDRGLAEWVREPLDRMIALELLRLDQLIRAYWARAAGGDAEAASFVLKVLERRARMLGLDSPKRVDIHALIVEWARENALPVDEVTEIVVGILDRPSALPRV